MVSWDKEFEDYRVDDKGHFIIEIEGKFIIPSQWICSQYMLGNYAITANTKTMLDRIVRELLLQAKMSGEYYLVPTLLICKWNENKKWEFMNCEDLKTVFSLQYSGKAQLLYLAGGYKINNDNSLFFNGSFEEEWEINYLLSNYCNSKMSNFKLNSLTPYYDYILKDNR